MKLTKFALIAALAIAGCNGDEQEQDADAVEHATPTPMPASAPADTVGGAADTAHVTTTTDTVPTTVTH